MPLILGIVRKRIRKWRDRETQHKMENISRFSRWNRKLFVIYSITFLFFLSVVHFHIQNIRDTKRETLRERVCIVFLDQKADRTFLMNGKSFICAFVPSKSNWLRFTSNVNLNFIKAHEIVMTGARHIDAFKVRTMWIYFNNRFR